ncbi:type VII secretion protein EssB [Listeria innocua]|uniref:type VII secretion protein EssB n=1 Tax=Listeria innocua TaxID=1642 RepID=UPI0016245376|nr:type VII secretion protein EssB [Listeria innocua]MBC1925543.1 type VII secretion protein EssB [Listeria innocua]
MKLFNGKETVEFIKEKDNIQVILDKTQYDKDSLTIIQTYLQAEKIEDNLTIRYELPQGAQPFTRCARNAKTKVEKLQLAEKFSQLMSLEESYQIPYLHPENLYLEGERLFVVYSGLEGILVPNSYDADLFLNNLKALILSLFNSKLTYEKALKGAPALSDKFSQTIIQTDSPTALFTFIRQELVTTQSKMKATKRVVAKNAYLFYRVIGVLALAVALVLGFFFYQTSKTSQKRADIIEAQTSFMTNNYAKTQSDLEKYAPKDLSKSAKYVLAVSSINLTDLTAAQKQAILNNISIKSDDNTLNYWLYVGRGEFEKALNLAQNLGDDQLTLLAYTDLYQATKLDNKMDGAKKQKRLADYNKQIEELTKKLGK